MRFFGPPRDHVGARLSTQGSARCDSAAVCGFDQGSEPIQLGGMTAKASTQNHGSAKHGLRRFWWNWDLVQTKGLAIWLSSAMKASMGATRCSKLANEAPLSEFAVRMENQISIWL
jgi:hypothetical protein